MVTLRKNSVDYTLYWPETGGVVHGELHGSLFIGGGEFDGVLWAVIGIPHDWNGTETEVRVQRIEGKTRRFNVEIADRYKDLHKVFFGLSQLLLIAENEQNSVPECELKEFRKAIEFLGQAALTLNRSDLVIDASRDPKDQSYRFVCPY